MNASVDAERNVITAIDLFAGCGGLSLGFELFRGAVKYETVLALDNNRQAVRCYNANEALVKGRSPTAHPTARLCDLNCFEDPNEVLLYYLAHLAAWRGDTGLARSLEKLNLPRFLGELRKIDEDATERLAEISSRPDYVAAFSNLDPRLTSLAVFKTFQAKLGLDSLRTLALSKELIWVEEYRVAGTSGSHPCNTEPLEKIRVRLQNWLTDEIGKLRDASKKSGRGQNAVVAERLKSFTAFLDSSQGKEGLLVWLDWRARRDSARANFVTKVGPSLTALYSDQRRVRLILGGPPCKGFSRIGRAVIVSLRDQGAHAWGSQEFGDERNALLYKYVLFLEALRPEAFLFENVAHFGSALKTPKGLLDASQMLEEAISTLSSARLHYHVSSSVVRAREFGVPQDRARFIMLGVRADRADESVADQFFAFRKYDRDVPLLAALQGLGPPLPFGEEQETVVRTSVSVPAYTLIDERMPEAYRRFVSWIRQPSAGVNSPPLDTDAHVYRRLRSDDLAVLNKFGPGQRWMDYKISQSPTLSDLRRVLGKLLEFQRERQLSELPDVNDLSQLIEKTDDSLFLRLLVEEVSAPLDMLQGSNHLLQDGYLAKGNDSHGDWFERLDALRPCKTIVAHIGKDTYGYFHPFESRAISIRETARIQTFPDFFKFGSAGVVDAYSMIGNAVPPMLANVFATRISELLFGQTTSAARVVRPVRRPQQQTLLQV